MNKKSLSHNYVLNQQKSSWNDDPFDLKDIFKEVMPYSHEQNLRNYAIELVATYAKYSNDHFELFLDMLQDDQKNELARLYIESIDREIEWACYGDDESLNSEFLCAMLAMLKNDTLVTRQRFAEVTRTNILTYYKQTLDDLLVTACEIYFQSMMNEQGYFAHQDCEHGDIVWGKIA